MAQELELILKGTDKTKGAIGSASSGIDKLKGGIKGIGTVAAGVAATGIGALVAGIGAVGAATWNATSDANSALNTLQAQLGVTGEDLDVLGDVAKEVFANNFGESITDAAQTVALVERAIGSLEGVTHDSIKQISEFAFAMEDAFGTDQQETIGAARALMKDFGISGQQAMDAIAFGIQTIPADDLLDTISEYGPLMADMGLSVEKFFSIMTTGAESGALGTDKIIDAMKEGKVQIDEMADSIVMFGAMLDRTVGEGTTDQFNALWKSVQAGEASTGDLVIEMLNLIGQMENANDQAIATKLGFGTMGEDLGNFAGDIDAAVVSLDDMSGAADHLNAQYKNLGSFFSGLWRKVYLDLGLVGERIMSIVRAVMPDLEESFGNMKTPIATFARFLGENKTEIVDFINGFIGGIGEAVSILVPIWESIKSGFSTVMDFIGGLSGGEEGGGIFAFLSEFSLPTALLDGLNLLGEAWEFLSLAAETVEPIFSNMATNLMPTLSKLGETLGNVWTTILAPAVEKVASLMPPLEKVLEPTSEKMGMIASFAQRMVEFLTPLAETIIGALTAGFETLLEFFERAQPTFEVIGYLFSVVLGNALEKISAAITENLQPAINRLMGVSENSWGMGHLEEEFDGIGLAITALQIIAAAFFAAIQIGVSIFEKFTEALGAVLAVIGSIKDGFSSAMGVIIEFGSALSSLDFSGVAAALPSFLIPGSPTPFELGLRGIKSAMDDLQTVSLPNLSMGVSGGFPDSLGGAGAMRASPFGGLSSLSSHQQSMPEITVTLDGEKVGQIISARQGKRLRHDNASSIGGRAKL